MARIAESELIINDRGGIYHLNLLPEELAHNIIVVGDPDRVKMVSKYFDRIEINTRHREFVTHTGTVGNKRISVISTGIGTDNIDIVLNEIDALVNIDLRRREIKPKLSSVNIIRIGTSGSLQADIPVDGHVAGTHGLGIDNLLNFYRLDQNDEEKHLLHSFVTHTQLHGQMVDPYVASASGSFSQRKPEISMSRRLPLLRALTATSLSGRPPRSDSRRPCSANNLTTPAPTVPSPAIPIRRGEFMAA